MNFGVNRLQNHHLDPRNRLDLIMMEPPEPEEEAGGGSSTSGGGRGGVEVEREHMFDKVVTPSDVGKLNRLVIPKQHAERFFPLDSSTNDKGLLLNFEDRSCKSWRFRYSYWNSSQSYVMTKGWSRFVKEKRLDAGDIVSFQRGVGEIGRDRLYIDWRRRPELPIHHHHYPTTTAIRPSMVVPSGAATPWGPLVWQPLGATTTGYHHQPAAVTPRDHTHLSRINNNNNNNNANNGNGMCCPYGYGSVETTTSPSSGLVYLRTELGGRSRRVAPRLGEEELELENYNYQMQQEYCSNGGGASMVVLQGNCMDQDHYHHHKLKTNDNNNHNNNNCDKKDTPVKKSRLRLFGVNMEMESPISSPSSDECDLLLSTNPKTTTTTTQFQLPSPSIYKDLRSIHTSTQKMKQWRQ